MKFHNLRRLKSHYLSNFEILKKDKGTLPLISIVVPLYNEVEFLEECLSSVKEQSYKNFECLIINDCSTDDSPKIAERFSQEDSRFSLIHHDENRGLSASRNTGLNQAKGEYITFLDSDDYLLPHSLWRRVQKTQETPAKDIAGSYCLMIYGPEKGTPIHFRSKVYPLKPKGAGNVDFISTGGDCPFNVHAVLARTDVLKKFEGFDESLLEGAEDWDLWMRMLRHGYRFLGAPIYGAVYRQKKRSMARKLVLGHCKAGMRILESAYQPWQTKLEHTPFPYTQPLGYYTEQLKRTRRLVNYITLAYLGEDRQALDHALDQLEPHSGHYVRLHLHTGVDIDRGIAKFHCIEPELYPKVASKYVEQKKKIWTLIFERID